MQVPGGDNAGPGRDILGPELMSEEKANGTIFELNFIFLQIFISEWTISLRAIRRPNWERF